MTRKFKLDFLATLSLVILPGMLVWVRPQWVGISADSRGAVIAALCAIFIVLWLVLSYSEASRAAVAYRAVKDWMLKHGGASDDVAQGATKPDVGDFSDLRQWLVEQHGWRWRWRERWILVVGDSEVVRRVAPTLFKFGYASAGGAVLLYAKQTDSAPDVQHLAALRRLRRRRPVDAVVALTVARATGHDMFDVQSVSQALARVARVLRWSAPVYLLNAEPLQASPSHTDEPPVGLTWSHSRMVSDFVGSALHDLTGELANAGVMRLSKNPADRYLAELSQHISTARESLKHLVTGASRSHDAIRGLFFTPLDIPAGPTEYPREAARHHAGVPEASNRTLWQTIANHSRKAYGRRVGLSSSSVAAYLISAVAVLWFIGSIISGMSNRATMRDVASTLSKVSSPHDQTQALLALDALDKQLDTLEIHRQLGAPWLARFGLNRDAALYEALSPVYQSVASRVLIDPIKARLESRLQQLASLSDAEIASGGNTQVQAAYDTLKAYLMLAHPEHADASFIATQLLTTNAPARPQTASVTAGTWEDLRQQAVWFYARHLKRGSASAIAPDITLVAATRQTIIGVRGIQNSTDAIYQQIIDETKPKYPPMTLATLLGDHPSRGLFNTSATVPGVFTRAAWDERIPKAIDEASEQRAVTGDWVLSDAKLDNTAPSTLKTELRQRYFDDYARAWQQFLNSIRWQNASSLSGTVDQLTLLGDPQRSPLVALMNALVFQASADASTQSISDALISKAQHLVGKDEKDPSKQMQPSILPLASAFGPILRLTGSELASNAPANTRTTLQLVSDLSLARYLERVTAVRLKTQQMMASPDPDGMSRVAAQAVLQGRTSDIADSRDYASRLSASLGEQWSGFGRLFEAPLDQTWQVVVQPASSSLNEVWRTSILADWNHSFGGRYPFADSDNDASLPDMAHFMRMDNGVIAQFVTTQLAGVIERQGDHWVATQGVNQGTLMLDPAFLVALNKLSRVARVVFPSGDARARYELRGVPTPGITDLTLVTSGQQLHYFNQMEQWEPFEWPGQALDNTAQLQWQTEAGGLRSTMYAQGRFALIRLLERAKVSQQDNARYLLSWTPDQSLTPPLSVQLRAETGAGPLDVLVLRHFALPERIFMSGAAKQASVSPGRTPPPLPPGALAAAQKIGVALPDKE
ncbi:ImcF-related family protein [Caballeronia sp. GAWG2-1]|uniref:ImcF-related family protein n=1 Tax=Caballeronia sp. GAWG2-1 TaxID=2921744 RepID=UPI0020298666|nr:ImcF-related family protein [Caballeronia sp. GAWG2-1]